MDDDTLIIKRAVNGFTIKYVGTEYEYASNLTNPVMRRAVIEGPEECASDAEHDAKLFQKLFWWLMEHYGVTGSKHDSHRLRLKIETRGEEIE